MNKLRLVALAAVLLTLAAACGGDDAADEPGTGTAQEGDHPESHETFCNSVVEAETAVLAASGGGDPSGIEDLIATVEESTPPELEEQVAVVTEAVRKALETQDDSPFGEQEFQRNEEEVDEWVADNCGFETIDVAAVDYAFEGIPSTLPAGVTTFSFSNEGEELHEMLMVRYKDESLTIDDLRELSDEEAEEKIVFLGASFGPPGASDTESKELTPGKYAVVCFVPVGSTSPKAARKADGPPHIAKGMAAEFTVE